MRLDVQIRAPEIVVPQHSERGPALVVDLGQLTIGNRFKMRPARNEIGSPAIVDEMSLQLADLRFYLTEDLDVTDGAGGGERSLVDPLTFDLTLRRNLTATWYAEEPELGVDVRLGAVHIRLSETDLAKMVSVVLGNLQEGADDARLQPAAAAAADDDDDVRKGGVASSAAEQGAGVSPSSDLSADDILQRYGPTRVTLAFSVHLEQIKMELWQAGTPLADLALRGFSVTGKVLSDRSVSCRVVLLSCLLEDTRPLASSSLSSSAEEPQQQQQRPIRRLLHPTDGAGAPAAVLEPKMFAVDYSKDKDGDAHVRLHMCGFTLVLCPNYLLRLSRFFAGPFAAAAPTPAAAASAASAKATTAKAVASLASPPPPTSSSSTQVGSKVILGNQRGLLAREPNDIQRKGVGVPSLN